MNGFCIYCWSKTSGTHPDVLKKQVVVSKDLKMCQGCGKAKPLIIRYQVAYILKEHVQTFFHQ